MLKTILFYSLILGLTGCAGGPAIQESPLVSNLTQITQAQQFNVLPDRANVYIKMKVGYNKLLVDGREQGVIRGGGKKWKEGEFFNFSASPGVVNFQFRRPIPYADDFEHLRHLVFADFDLDFSAGSVVLIECEASSFSGAFTITRERPPGDALRRFAACPAGANVTLDRGTKACALPYKEKSYSYDYTEIGKLNKKTGQCFLVSDKKVFEKATMVQPERQHVTTLDYELAKARQINTVAALESVLTMYPGTSRKPEIDQAIQGVRLEQARQARKQQVEDRLKRDSHLPLQVQQDKYMLTLKDLLTKQEFEASLFYFELLNTMGVQLSPSVGFFWGEALVRTGRPKPALEKLYKYIETEGSKGQFYERALVLSSEAEASL